MTGLADDRTSPGDDALARAAEDVADGRSVDWAALGGHAHGSEAVELLTNLQIIGAIADVHRSVEESTHVSDSESPIDANQPPPPGAGEPWGKYRLLQRVGSGSFGSV